MKALGMIETYGLIGAIEAADVMLKVANVSLVKAEKVRGGLVTICIEGDVGAVKTAVEAGASAVERLSGSCLHTSHVIPRPDNQSAILYKKKEEEKLPSLEGQLVAKQEEPPQIKEVVESVPVVPIPLAEQEKSFEESAIEKTSLPVEEPHLTFKDYKKRLDKTKAADLRAMIATNPNITVAAAELSGLIRREMIRLLLEDFTKHNGSKE